MCLTRLCFVDGHWYRVIIGTELAPSPIGELLVMRYLLVLTNSLSPRSDLCKCILVLILVFLILVHIYIIDSCGSVPSMCLARLYFAVGHWYRVIIGRELAPSNIGELLAMRYFLVLTNS